MIEQNNLLLFTTVLTPSDYSCSTPSIALKLKKEI